MISNVDFFQGFKAFNFNVGEEISTLVLDYLQDGRIHRAFPINTRTMFGFSQLIHTDPLFSEEKEAILGDIRSRKGLILGNHLPLLDMKTVLIDKEFLAPSYENELRVNRIKLRVGSESTLAPISTSESVGLVMEFSALFATESHPFPVYKGRGIAIFLQKENANGPDDVFLFWFVSVPANIIPVQNLGNYVMDIIYREIV